MEYRLHDLGARRLHGSLHVRVEGVKVGLEASLLHLLEPPLRNRQVPSLRGRVYEHVVREGVRRDPGSFGPIEPLPRGRDTALLRSCVDQDVEGDDVWRKPRLQGAVEPELRSFPLAVLCRRVHKVLVGVGVRIQTDAQSLLVPMHGALVPPGLGGQADQAVHGAYRGLVAGVKCPSEQLLGRSPVTREDGVLDESPEGHPVRHDTELHGPLKLVQHGTDTGTAGPVQSVVERDSP
mmetsp:Transcript_17205/g.38915  ORF Transcript_17205/g.38915 Transcript_17205/m.38915 type:complete len:236 (-) Transcript_17205:646-1353(-)